MLLSFFLFLRLLFNLGRTSLSLNTAVRARLVIAGTKYKASDTVGPHSKTSVSLSGIVVRFSASMLDVRAEQLNNISMGATRYCGCLLTRPKVAFSISDMNQSYLHFAPLYSAQMPV